MVDLHNSVFFSPHTALINTLKVLEVTLEHLRAVSKLVWLFGFERDVEVY